MPSHGCGENLRRLPVIRRRLFFVLFRYVVAQMELFPFVCYPVARWLPHQQNGNVYFLLSSKFLSDCFPSFFSLWFLEGGGSAER